MDERLSGGAGLESHTAKFLRSSPSSRETPLRRKIFHKGTITSRVRSDYVAGFGNKPPEQRTLTSGEHRVSRVWYQGSSLFNFVCSLSFTVVADN